MATIVNRYVNTASTAGTQDGTTNRDGNSGTAAYESLNTALIDVMADYPNFVTSDVQVNIFCSGGIDSGNITQDLTDSTMDETRYLWIGPETDNDWNQTGVYDSTNYYTVEPTNLSVTAFVGTFAASPCYVIFEKLQFHHAPGTNPIFYSRFCYMRQGTAIFKKCIIKNQGLSTDTRQLVGRAGDQGLLFFEDCLIFDYNVGPVFNSNKNAGIEITNCTVRDCITFLDVTYGGNTQLVTNCLLSNVTNILVGSGGFNASSDYNSTDLGTGPTNWGANSLTGQSVTFADSANDNFNLGPGDTPLHNSGIGTTNANVSAVDLIGNSRGIETASIGALQYVPALIDSTPRHISSIKEPWTRQPPAGTKINMSHPLTKDLVHAYVLNTNSTVIPDLVGNNDAVLVVGNTDWMQGRNSISPAFRYAGNTKRYDFNTDIVWTDDAPASVVVGAQRLGTNIFHGDVIGGTGGRLKLRTEANSVQVTYSLHLDQNITDPTIIPENPTNYVLLHDGGGTTSGTSYLYANGELSYTSASTHSNGCLWSNIGDGSEAGAQAFYGVCSYVYYYDRQLTESEIKELETNPWQIFEPRTIYGLNQINNLNVVVF